MPQEQDSANQAGSTPIDVSQITQLLIHHRGALLGYLLSCVRQYSDAEDLFQDVCLAATKSAGDLRSSDGFLPWAREIARRRVLEYYRKSKRLTPIDPELVNRLAETAARMDENGDIPERLEALRTCLEDLPVESKKLLVLRYEDYKRPVASIAEYVGRSIQATYAILKRSRLLLRECITRKLSAGAPE